MLIKLPRSLSVVSFRPMFAMLATLSLCVGCGDEMKVAETDEAAKRAIAEGVSVEAAAEYFTYQNSAPDFFAGMDAISSPSDLSLPDPLLKPNPDGFVNRPTATVASPALNPSETIGRNTWMVWCAGNEGFWDWLATDSLGFIDLVKLLDSRKRNDRFRDAGLINEPGMDRGNQPVEFGLWLDVPQDPAVRDWREHFVDQTFERIEQGQHKSQIGLKRRNQYGVFDGENLFVGNPMTFEGQRGYEYPSNYLGEQTYAQSSYARGTAAGGTVAGGYESAGNAKYEHPLDKVVPPPDLYGISSGVVGLRLFPNPYFDEQARAKWDPKRYYDDPTYYNDPTLIRPYRVGMSCAFCHASYHPLRPPKDTNYPQWENISGNIGAQYLSMRATVGGQLTPDQFVYHLLDSQPRGTIDTSLIASDNINNPNTMNAVFGLKQRALVSFFNPKEELSTSSAKLASIWNDPKAAPGEAGKDAIQDPLRSELESMGLLAAVQESNENPRNVPRILLDGSDSIGAVGALARVYLNIGTYWEQWNQLHQTVLGFTPQDSFRIADCDMNSVYWNATKRRVPGLRDYFLKVTPTMPLLSTPGGEQRLAPINETQLKLDAEALKIELPKLREREKGRRVDVGQLARGRQVFAENCIVCHSSIQPESMQPLIGSKPKESELPPEAFEQLIAKRIKVRSAATVTGEFCEHNPGQWLEDENYRKWASSVVELPKFWTENYLSTDYRIPVTVVGTNSARAMATNGMSKHMWEDFASESYRKLPSPGAITYFNPYAGENGAMQSYMPRHQVAEGVPEGGGGPGFYRVPTLMSIWATAPLLHNNSLGLYNNDPSVDGRLDAFDDAIRKLLWPARRLESSSYNGATAERLQRDQGLIWRTPQVTYLSIDGHRVPYFARRLPWIQGLYEHALLKWLQLVKPLWLPSIILLFGAMVILQVHNSGRRQSIAAGAVAVAVVCLIAFLLAAMFPALTSSQYLLAYSPWWLVPLLLGVIAVVLWLPLSHGWSRFVSYLFVAAALFFGAIVYFNGGHLGDVKLGPIPAGTPVNLLANFNSEAGINNQLKSIRTVAASLAEIESRHLDAEATEQVMKTKVAPALLEVNKCPDFVMDRGHYFPWFENMSDADKNALIELLKTL